VKEIKEALKRLNVKGTITVKQIAADRIAIYVNNEYFGVWDTVRKIFVD
jgi:hypothetical protein